MPVDTPDHGPSIEEPLPSILRKATIDTAVLPTLAALATDTPERCMLKQWIHHAARVKTEDTLRCQPDDRCLRAYDRMQPSAHAFLGDLNGRYAAPDYHESFP
jgi:hypothetical protein